MKDIIYEQAKNFKKKYPMTISWRIKKHAKIIDKHLNPGEVVKYAFCAQKNNNPFDIITTYAVVLTNKRILLGSKRVLFGYFFRTKSIVYISVTPEIDEWKRMSGYLSLILFFIFFIFFQVNNRAKNK